MNRRTASTLAALFIASPLWPARVCATETPPPPPAAAETPAAPVLAPGTEITIACTTKSVVVATAAAKVSNGPVGLVLAAATSTASGSGPLTGSWRIVSVGDQHQASFAATQREVCKNGCPLAVQPSGEVQLWAPKLNTLDKIGDGELLFVAVLKPASLDLRASTFRGKDIEALEQGTCRKVDP